MYFAVVNLGLKSIRTVVFNEKGEIVSKSSLPVKTFILGSHVEQDPNEWWNGFIYTFREATKEINVRKKVKYISFTASAACIVPVNKVGLPLYNAIMVSDKRAVKQSEKVKMTTSYKEIEKQGVKSSSYMLLEKAMWISENLKDIKNEIAFFLTPNDFFIYRMTGTALTDTYNAQKFYAKGYKYPTELYNEVGLEIGTFPSIASPGTLVGKTKSSVLRAMGLSQPLEVILGTYDAISAFIGSCPTDVNVACDISGTVTSIRMLSSRDFSNNCFFSRLLDTKYFIHGSSNNLSGGLIEWLKQSFYPSSKDPYKEIEIEAEKSGLGARGLIFLPYILGERSPIWDNNARGIFLGVERFHNRGDFSRSILESCAFISRDLIEVLPTKPTVLKLSGGLSRIGIISEIKTNVCNVETQILSEFETTALGTFIIAYSSVYKEDITRAMKQFAPPPLRILYPDPEKAGKYNEIFKFYKKLYLVNKELFQDRIKLLKCIGNGNITTLENL